MCSEHRFAVGILLESSYHPFNPRTLDRSEPRNAYLCASCAKCDAKGTYFDESLELQDGPRLPGISVQRRVKVLAVASRDGSLFLVVRLSKNLGLSLVGGAQIICTVSALVLLQGVCRQVQVGMQSYNTLQSSNIQQALQVQQRLPLVLDGGLPRSFSFLAASQSPKSRPNSKYEKLQRHQLPHHLQHNLSSSTNGHIHTS